MNIAFIVITLVILGAMIYAGIRDGAFFSLYALLRNLLGFLVAMSFTEPVTQLVLHFERLQLHPGPLYVRAFVFPTLFAVVFAGMRWLKTRYTTVDIAIFVIPDRIVGGIFGLLNGIVMVGLLLIVWSFMPFAKFLPGDFGRVNTDTGILFPGRLMLRFYDFTTRRMPGGRMFLLEDEPVVRDSDGDGEFDPPSAGFKQPELFRDLNENGLWDRGWLWRYKNHADIHMKDMEGAASVVRKKFIREPAEPEGGPPR
jgi:hypothetical protein